jgi:hypothetical protein
MKTFGNICKKMKISHVDDVRSHHLCAPVLQQSVYMDSQ